MRMILMIAGIILLANISYAVEYEDAPPYTNGQYYVWSNATTATNALNAINATSWFPIVGRNAKTGEPEPDKAKTTSWANAVLSTLTGKFVFPRIPTALMDALKVPEAERKAWWDAFTPDVETAQPGWFPEDDEE